VPRDVPLTWGVLSFAGEPGIVAVIWGVAGAVVSTVKVREAGLWSAF
jgi:hypothetical protein